MDHEKRRRRVNTKLKRVNGSGRVRLLVRKTARHIYASLISPTGDVLKTFSDQALGKTISVASADALGRALGEFAKTAGVTKVYFDRNGYPYHGRVKTLAEAARGAGLEF